MAAALPQQLLLIAAFAALAFAAWRVAARVAEPGLERFVAAAPLMGAAAALEALLLGRLGWGGSAVALAVAAGLTAAAALFVPRPVGESAWTALSRREKLAWGAVAGGVLVWVAWILRRPLIGIDGITYQLAEAASWVHSGDTGSAVQTFYDIPTASYPLANEVLLSWVVGVSGSLAAALLVGPVLAGVLGASGWLGLRRLGVPRRAAGLALAALLSLPFVVRGVGQPGSDIPAAAWLACCAALVAASRRRPPLLGPALVAAGLAIGTKTTALPLTLVLVAGALWMHRRELARPGVAVGLVAGAVVGLGWYARNLLDHGSPLWPFAGGEAQPPLFRALNHSLLERPRATLEGRLGSYFDDLGGAVVLFPAAVVAAVAVRRRLVVGLALAAVGALALWAAGPITGLPDVDQLGFLPATAIRYLLPGLLAAAAAVALAGRPDGFPRAALGGLGLAVLVSLDATWPFGFPHGPALITVAAGAAVGAAVGALVRRVPAPGLALAAAGLVAAVALALAADGFVERHASLRSNRFSELTLALGRLPGFDASTLPVATNTSPIATLAGDRLDRAVELIPTGETCSALERRLRRSWVILQAPPPFTRGGRPTGLPTPGPAACLRGLRPVRTVGTFRVYAPTG